MPVAYPPQPATIAGDLITIHRMLRNPAVLSARMQQLSMLGFIADELLPNKYRTSGGAVSYEMGEPLFTDREIGAVAPGAEYPRALPATGQMALAQVTKWGQATTLTDERIKRTLPMGSAIDWALRKVMNTIVKKIDRMALAAFASAVSDTIIGTDWTTPNASNILLDLELAKAQIDAKEMGYNSNAILISTNKYAYLANDDKIATLRRREATDNPVYGGTIETIGGLRILKTQLSNLPGGLDDVWVLDTSLLGGMADEADLDPGYARAENGIQVQTLRNERTDSWDVWARRITVPIITEPAAAVRITGTNG
jgi:hypothetical protein